MSITAYPLCWPPDVPRSPHRTRGPFRTPYLKALQNVRRALQAFAKVSNRPVTQPVLSMNIDLAGRYEAGDDPGVAVWFTWGDLPVCISVDRYTTPAANLQAIHHIIKARRLKFRDGAEQLPGASLQDAAREPNHWSDILGVERGAKRTDIEAAFRHLARAHHPDTGGSAERMAALNQAREAALNDAAR